MDQLSQLYSQYNNFATYRNEKLNAIDDENESLKIQIKKLELEKKQAQLEYDMKIHELKSQVNTTKVKARINEELNQEKADLKQKLHLEITKHFENGLSAREIANRLGLSSTTLIYQAVNGVGTTATESPVAVEWVYFDNAAIHRYAVSKDRKYIKVHGTGDKYKIVTVEDLRYVSGDQDVAMNGKRVKIALESFDGTYEGSKVERKNPYADRESA